MKGSVRIMTEVAMAAALSMVLSLIVFYRLPQGGNVSFSMVPIFLMAFRRGPLWGIATGVVAGALQMIVDPYFLHPLQVALDYFLAWGAIGLAGLLPADRAWSAILGMVVGSAGRFVFHYLSGVWFFAHFAPEGMAVWYYVTTYILSHLIPQTLLSFVLLVPAMRRLYLLQ